MMAGRISFNMMSLLSSPFRLCEERSDEAIHSSLVAMDCFAPLAMTVLSQLSQVQGGDHEVDGLDADKGNDDAAEAVDHQVTAQQRAGTDGPIRHALQGEWNQPDDDQRVEDDRRQD